MFWFNATDVQCGCRIRFWFGLVQGGERQSGVGIGVFVSWMVVRDPEAATKLVQASKVDDGWHYRKAGHQAHLISSRRRFYYF